MVRLHCQSQIKHKLPPFYFPDSLSMGWTLCNSPCLLWDSTKDCLHSGSFKQARATPESMEPPCLARLSPKSVSQELQKEEEERRKTKRKKERGKTVMSGWSQTLGMDNQVL